jgi:tetratricopeptide (TPR) repeat protein/O-antigen ligase
MEGLMEAAWLAAVILVPVFFDIYSSRIFEPDKITLLRTLALLTLGAWIVKLVDEGGWRWEHIQPGESKLKTILQLPMIIPVAILALTYVIATIFSVTPKISLWGSYQRLQGTYTTFAYLVFFSAILGNLRKRAQVERIITTIILGSLPVSLYGILQHYKLDPVPWGGDVSTRIAANMGNAIFVAAYLIMVIPLVVARIIQSFSGIMNETNRSNLVGHILRGTFYVFTGAVVLIAQYMSQSRGPGLGWIAGSFVIFILLSIYWRKRWLTYVAIGAVAVVCGFLLLFNIQGGPFETLRDSPAIGRYSQLLNENSNNALVRKYIWEGAAKLVSIHNPLQFPDGSQDTFNFLRPLIGYGPESMYVAYNPFYIPELGQVEKRNASPDRSHNETWDTLVITGVFGLLAYFALITAIFYYSLKWIGLIVDAKQRTLFFGLLFGGGVIGAAGMILWRGLEYFGVGLPFGMVGGLIAYITLIAIVGRYTAPQTNGESARMLILIVLLAVIVSHFIEINFGIAIAVTRTYFWIFSALILVVGYILPLHGEYKAAAPINEKNPEKTTRETRKTESRSAHARRKKPDSTTSPALGGREWMRTGLIGAFILTLIVMTLGYDLISNSGHYTSTLTVLWNSLTQLPNRNNATVLGILAMILITWIGAGILVMAESIKEGGESHRLSILVIALGASAVYTLIFWLWHSGELVALAVFTPTTIEQVITQIDKVGGLLTTFYVFVLLLIALAAFVLPEEWPARFSGANAAGPALGLALLVIFIWLTNTTNLRIIYADIAFKMADPFNTQGQWPIATVIYKHANELAPDEDHYYLFLGRSYLEQAKAATTADAQATLVNQSESDLKVAQKLNPLNTDHTANLARLYSWWASVTTDSAQYQNRANIASAYYEKALTLSPQNSTLWGEMAILYLDVLHQPQEAYQRLSHALELDPLYDWTQGLMGDYYVKISQTITDTTLKDADLNQALDHYTQAYKLATSSADGTAATYLISMGSTYAGLGKLDDALNTYSQTLALNPSQDNIWKIQETMARIYAQKGDKKSALASANLALSAAPKAQQTSVQTLIDQIQTMP